jgi:hypothetical protein
MYVATNPKPGAPIAGWWESSAEMKHISAFIKHKNHNATSGRKAFVHAKTLIKAPWHVP